MILEYARPVAPGKAFSSSKYMEGLIYLCVMNMYLEHIGIASMILRQFITGVIDMPTVLIVENNDFFRRTFREILQMHLPTLDVLEASEGTEALLKIHTHQPEIIFMDINLPGTNGLELTRRIKTAYPGLVVAIFTNYDLPEYRESALECNADHFMVKDSLSGAEIAALVRSIVENKEPGNPGKVAMH